MNALRNMLNEFYDNIPEHFRQPVLDAINAADENEEDHVVNLLHQLIVDLNRGQSNAAINTYMGNPATRGSATRRFFFPHTLSGLLHPEDAYVAPPRPSGSLALERSPALSLVPPPNPIALEMAMAATQSSRPRAAMAAWSDPLRASASVAISSEPVVSAWAEDPALTHRPAFDPLPSSRAISTTDLQGTGAYDALFQAVPSLAPALRMNARILSQQESAAMVVQARDQALNALHQPIVNPWTAADPFAGPFANSLNENILGRRQTLQNDLEEGEIYE